MSGIAGIYFSDGRPVKRDSLERMVETIAHRGPDGSGVWHQGAVGLGHRLLWTTPESLQEKLPLADASGELVITADARIDNRQELLSALNFPSGSAAVTDSHLILAAYEKWGERCPEKLLGDFAFAIWDGRRQALFCARDHLGVKPFYYYRSPRAFRFASEMKALLCLPETPRRLNERMLLHSLLSLEVQDRSLTVYEDILRLPPAHVMMVSRQGTRISPYWSPDPYSELRFKKEAEYLEAFRSLFTEAVRCRLRSAFPVGCMLSGGLDSSAVACVGQEILDQAGGPRLLTFSGALANPDCCGESPFINAVLRHKRFDAHITRNDQVQPFLADLERLLRNQEGPFEAAEMFIQRIVYGAARNQGCRVVLDGVDGDCTTSLRSIYLAELLRRRRWTTLAREVGGVAKRLGHSRFRVLWCQAVLPLSPPPIIKYWYKLVRRLRREWDPSTVIHPDLAQRLGVPELIAAEDVEYNRLGRSMREDHVWSLTTDNIPTALERYDKTAAFFSIESRHPFLDKKLVEFCLAMPAEQKFCGGWTKMIIRRALAGFLPEEVRWRRDKTNLTSAFVSSILSLEKGLIKEFLTNGMDAIRSYLDASALHGAHQRYLRRASFEDAMTLWTAASLAQWLGRTFQSTSRARDI